MLYITPSFNYGDYLHIFTRSNSNYLNYIDTYKIATLSYDNYRINTNTAKCNLTTSLTELNYDRINYIAEIDSETGYFKYYRVISSLIQSGFVIFTLEIDLWASYITLGGISIHEVYRSTRLLGGGFYEDIKVTDGELDYELIDGQKTATVPTHFKDTAVRIVMLVQYNISQAVFGDDKISQTELFSATIADIASHADRSSGSIGEYKSTFEIALSLVGGVFSATANIGVNDAQILKAWVIPNAELETADYGITLKTKSIFVSGNHETTFDVAKVLPSKLIDTHTIKNYNPNKVYYGGTYNNGLKLRNMATSDLVFYTHVIVGDSDVKVIASQGERQQDITNGFEVKLNTNGETKTGIRKLAEAFDKAVSLGTASAKGIMAGGAGASIGALTIGQGIARMVNDFGIESARGNGDAFLNYYQTNPLTEVLSPYCLTYFDSVNDEVSNALVNGLVYANLIYEETLSYYLINETPLEENYVDFLQCKATCSSVQKNASDFIINELARGIHISDIDE